MTKEQGIRKEILDSLFKAHGKDCFEAGKVSKTKMSLQVGKASAKEFEVGSEDMMLIIEAFDEFIEKCNSKLN